jgi:hypothetical protein
MKYSSLHFVVALAPFAVWALARSAPSRANAFGRMSLWFASLAVVASPWYLRNLVLFSNPVFPFMNETLGVHNNFTREQSVLLHECFYGLGDFSLRAGTPATFVPRVTKGFGILPVTLLLPGALLALRSARRGAGILVAGTAVSHMLLTLFVGFWEPRYFLSALVLSSALAAVALQSLLDALDRGRLASLRLGPLTLVAAAGVAVWDAYPRWLDHCRDARAAWRQGREAFVENHVRYFAVARWLNAHMSDHDRVAIGFNIQPFYYLERPYYHIHPLTQGDLVSAQTPEEVEAALHRVGATLLAFSGSDGTYFERTAPRITAYRERLWRAQRGLRQAGRLRLVTTISGVRILRIEGGVTHMGDESQRAVVPPP